jgi:hypothetical protein
VLIRFPVVLARPEGLRVALTGCEAEKLGIYASTARAAFVTSFRSTDPSKDRRIRPCRNCPASNGRHLGRR